MQELCYFKDNQRKHECNSFTLLVLTIDFQSGTCIDEACYQLHTHNGRMLHAMSDCQGKAKFPNLPPGNYSLIQSIPPCGYEPNPYSWKIKVDYSGYIWIDGMEKDLLKVYNTLNSSGDFGGIHMPSVNTQPHDNPYKVNVIDVDIADIQIIGHKIDMVAQGYNVTVCAKNYPRYELVSPSSQIFYNVQQEKSCFFCYKKISN